MVGLDFRTATGLVLETTFGCNGFPEVIVNACSSLFLQVLKHGSFKFQLNICLASISNFSK